MKTCYTNVRTSFIIGIIKEGETGYYPTDIAECNGLKSAKEIDAFVDELNAKIDITKGERQRMEIGSMFGWDAPGAQPGAWNDDGTPNRAKEGII